MGKLVKIILFMLLLVLVVAGVGVYFLDDIVKSTTEKAGSKITKVPVSIELVNLSLFTTSGKVQGFTVANPEGFKTPYSIKFGTMTTSLKKDTLLNDIIVIDEINVSSVDMNFEQKNLIENNLMKIFNNVKSAAVATSAAIKHRREVSTKRVVINRFNLENITVNVDSALVRIKQLSVPDIHLKNIGKDEGGLIADEMAVKLMLPLLSKVIEGIRNEGIKLDKSKIEKTIDTIKVKSKGILEELKKSLDKLGQ